MKRLGVLLRNDISGSAWAAIRSAQAPKPEFAALVEGLNGVLISAASGPKALRRFPIAAAAVAAFRQRKNIDALYVCSEDLALVAAPLLRIVGWRRPIVVVVHAAVSPKMQRALRLVGKRTFSYAICVSEEQRKLLISRCNFSQDQAVHAYNWVDTDFLSSDDPLGEFVFACGLENRDYKTLLEAAALTTRPFVVCAGGFHGHDATVAAPASTNVTIIAKRLPWVDLRDYYRRARLVVVPLNDVRYAAGVTSLVEASAMGKPVIASDSKGIKEYPAAAKVPPADPAALAFEIDRLWSDSEVAEKSGVEAKVWARKSASLDCYVARVADLVAR